MGCESHQLWKTACCMLLLCIVVLVSILAAMYEGVIPLKKTMKIVDKDKVVIPTTECPRGQQETPPHDDNRSVFDEISADETKEVFNYLQKNVVKTLKPTTEAKMNDAFIHLVESILPKKADVLEYLDKGGPRPKRQGKAYVTRGDLSVPVVEVYEVDLPTTRNISALVDTQPFYKSPISDVENAAIAIVMKEALSSVDFIFKESYDASYAKCEDDKCLTYTFMGPHGIKSKERRTWCWVMRALEGEFIQTVGFQVLVYHEGTNTSNWYVDQVYYNGQRFDNVSQLETMYKAGTLIKIKLPWPGKVSHSTSHRRGPPPPMSDKRPPRMYEPDGHRYSMNGRHVEYMGWQIDFALRTFNGLQLYDIRYNKERVVYEVGPQEMVAFYSGSNAVRMHTNYWDGSYLIGVHHHELLRGIDCPEYASMVDSTHFWNGPRVHKNTVCVFEWNTGVPLRRHFTFQYGGDWDVYSGMTDNVLVVRSIAAVYNYDYVFDYVFHQSGALEVKWTPTGYVQGSFYTEKDAPYAFQLWDHGAANLHNHLSHYRVDIDILGTKNSFQTLDIELEEKPSPFYPGYNHTQKVIKRNKRKTELDAALHYDFDKPKFYLIQKDNATNAHGETRGYRISVHGMSKMMYPENTGVEPGASWARYQLSVTKHRENETRSSSMFMQSDPFTPHVNFQDFINNDENIVNEDLVAWVTLGTMHSPRAEDIPITHTSGITQSFFILPFNYFDIDPSLNSRDAVRITPKVSGKYDKLNIDGNGLQPIDVCRPRKFPINFDGTRFIV